MLTADASKLPVNGSQIYSTMFNEYSCINAHFLEAPDIPIKMSAGLWIISTEGFKQFKLQVKT